MSRSQASYFMLERVFGRGLLWRVGRWLYCGARREFTSNLAANGEYALQERVAAHLAKSDRQPVILDIGANLGGWSRPFGEALRAAGAKEAHLVAFEPGPGQRERLGVNLQGAPGFGQIDILPYAVAAENGTAEFVLTGESTGNSGLMPSGGRPSESADIVEVETRTLDSLMSDLGLAEVDFVKVDTEGNDPNVLTGAKETLASGRIGCLQFEYNYLWLHNRFSLLDIYKFVDGLDYRVGKVAPHGIEIYDSWHFELDRYVMANFVLLRTDLVEALDARAFRFDPANVPVAATD
ncbi:MAG: FkbM family methyltransferase [Pseudomonadota bacterium]